jgi:hypothetical protein
VDQTGSPTKEGNNNRGKKKTQQQQSVPINLGHIELRKTQTTKRSWKTVTPQLHIQLLTKFKHWRYWDTYSRSCSPNKETNHL